MSRKARQPIEPSPSGYPFAEGAPPALSPRPAGADLRAEGQAPCEQSGGTAQPPAAAQTQEPKPRPVEIRRGKVKARIWTNQTAAGPRHAVEVLRIFKDDEQGQWKESHTLGRDDLLAAARLLEAAWEWIHAHQQ
jgi:hypothetical protein